MSDALTGAAAQFGIINSLRTGNQILDMLVCLLVPLFFTGIANALGGVAPAVAHGARALKNRTRVVRVVRHVKRTNAWGYAVHSSSRDNVLQRALLLYLSKHVSSGHKHARMSLTQIKEKTTRAWYDSDSGSDSDDEGGLRKLEVTTLPPQDVEVHLGDGVWLEHSVEENNEGGGEKSSVSFKEETTKITLSASGPAAEERIQGAVDKAYRWYAATQQVKKDETRYMFQMLRPRSGGDNENGGAGSRYFKRYALSNEKTFSSLFFEEKERLLYLLDHFANKSGKFAIPGFPHKLGLLLYGPPGTGKTSLIKAMSHHTGRHIVSVPLSKIRTNQELMDLMFDGAYKAINAGKRQDEEDAETLVTVPLGKCIFVMEDVDAAGKVVHRRAAAGATKSVTKTVTRSTSRAVSGGMAADGTTAASPPSSTPRAAAAEPTAKVADAFPAAEAAAAVAAPPLPPLVVDDAASAAAESPEEMGIVETTITTEAAMPLEKDKALKALDLLADEDKLDLAGLLNVLDGVVDAPNRIVVMTTNHPEKLDPALIRPGRINKQIYLGYLQLPQATALVEHYFGEMSTGQRHRMSLMFQPDVFTPAQVEQLCAEYDTIEDFLLGLNTLSARQY